MGVANSLEVENIICELSRMAVVIAKDLSLVDYPELYSSSLAAEVSTTQS